MPSGYTPFRFQGSWHDDATDLAWVVTRWYAPSLGRFVSEDSLLGEPINPRSRHLYAYGEGEPISRWDPDGRTYAKLIFSETIELPGWYRWAWFIAGTTACWGFATASAIPSGGASLAFGLACGAVTEVFQKESDRAVHTYRATPWIKSLSMYRITERWSYWERTVNGNLNYKGVLIRQIYAKQRIVLAYSNWCALVSKQDNFHLNRTCLGWW